MVRKLWAIVIVIAAAVAAAVVIAVHVPDPGLSPALAQRQPDVTHGQYIAALGDCAACHTKPGGKALAGGLPLKTPLGTIYTTNITPDRDTGIGNYSFADFARAMRLGVRPDGARLYPAMPYTAYAKMFDEDLQDLFAYLQKNIAPVSQTPPANTVAWPLDTRWPVAFWNVAFLDSSHFTPDPAKDASWNRGAYIVEALEHCGECHTPRRVTQNLDNAQKFSGAVLQGWKAYNVTSSKQSGVGGWSDEALASYLSTGHADGHSSASGPMAEAVDNSLRYATPDDIHAIVAYLRSTAPIDNAPAIAQNPPAANEASPPAGPRRPGVRRQLRQLPRLGRQGRAIALRRPARQPHRQRPRRDQSDGDPARRLERPAAGRARLHAAVRARPQRRRTRRRGEFCQRLLRQRFGESHRSRHRQGAQGAAVVTRRTVSHLR